MDYSLTGSSVHGILQARMLEWIAMPCPRGSSWPRDRTRILMLPALAGEFFSQIAPLGKYSYSCSVQLLSCVRLFATPRTLARQASLSITNSWSLLKLMSIKSWCHPTICHPLLLSPPSSPTFNLSQHQGLFQWVGSLHQVVKVLEFQLQHQSFHWTLRTDLL